MSAAPAVTSTPAPSTASARHGFALIPTQRHTDYTTRYRCVGEADDIAIHTHANGICVLTLAPTHPIRRLEKTVTEISWHGTSSNDRSQTKVSGKRKRGGYILEPNSVLCKITCTDATVHEVRASVHGLLVETNDALRSKPSLLTDPAHAAWDGFLAMFALSAKHRNMLSVDDRAIEGSEAERDLAEGRQTVKDAVVPAPMDATAKEAESKAHVGSEHGPDWRTLLEYLKPSEYEERRKHLFVQPPSATAVASATYYA